MSDSSIATVRDVKIADKSTSAMSAASRKAEKTNKSKNVNKTGRRDSDEFDFKVTGVDEVLNQIMRDLKKNQFRIDLSDRKLQELGLLRRIPSESQKGIKEIDIQFNLLYNIDSLSSFDQLKRIDASHNFIERLSLQLNKL